MADLKSWNPWHGCRKYSEGCVHCYMYALDRIREVPERSAQITRTQAMLKPLASGQIECVCCGGESFGGEPEYKLIDPFDGHRLAAWELMERRYHADKCPGCTMMELCIGCVDCGSCKNIRLVGFDEAARLRNERLSSKERP